MGNIAASLFNRVRSHPSALALSAGTRSLSFGQFGERVGRLAGSLRVTAGLAPGDRVVLCMENRPEFLEVLFACWTAGLCAVPINAKLHPKEQASIAEDCGAGAVFTSESLLAGLSEEVGAFAPAPAIHVVGTAAYERLASGLSIPCTQVSPTDLAWIFYTSGTTGRPKGAMLSHRNLLAMSMAYYADIERVEPGDTKLHAAPLSHASGLYSLPHLFGGGHQVILPGFQPDDVFESFVRHRNVTMFAAPTMVMRLLQEAPAQERMDGLRTLYYGGGPMYVSDLVKAVDLFGPRLYQLFGQGESPMTISGLSKRDHEGDRGPAHLAILGSCGTPRAGVEVRVVDESGKDVEVGMPGEVATRSDCVMSGYWNNREASASALRDGWLWTGDVGSLDERGYLMLRDRSKDLIISGGTNIYPREIEEVLHGHPAVLECSVVGRPHAEWGEEVVAFVVFKPGASASTADLDSLCLENIARFKRPRQYRIVDALPKNNYGKVLKTGLRQTLHKEGENA
jgi:acyl-CoA synthetase (AMP-forming)/AMP-acid ligase II